MSIYLSLILSPLALSTGSPQAKVALTGGYHRPVMCRVPAAQVAFDEGLALFYAFHKQASKERFAQAAKLDPSCAMAFWGEAMAQGPDINFTSVDVPASKAAKKLLVHAKLLAKSPVERGLINAGLARFARSEPALRGKLDANYSRSLAGLWSKFNGDPDVGSLYAESILILNPWNNWLPGGVPRPGTVTAINVLNKVLKTSPKHLMANHMMIHAVEAGPRPELGLKAANTLRDLHLTLGHLVHMPSHIYIRTGMYADGIMSNDRAIFRDRAFFAKRGPSPIYLPYMAHNRMMLAFAASMNGSYKMARSAMDDLHLVIPPAMMKEMAFMLDGYMTMPMDVDRRFGQWDRILSAPEPPSYLPIGRANRYANRAIAFAAKHQPEQAEAEFAKFLVAKKKVPSAFLVGLNPASSVLAIEEHLAKGEMAVLRGDFDKGIPELKKAIEIEDQLKYDEPPDWIQPVRHTLGAALLTAGRPQEALVVYEEDLRRNPNNGWSLLGLSQSHAALGDLASANKYRNAYEAMWSKEDEAAGSSCRCLPAPKQ